MSFIQEVNSDLKKIPQRKPRKKIAIFIFLFIFGILTVLLSVTLSKNQTQIKSEAALLNNAQCDSGSDLRYNLAVARVNDPRSPGEIASQVLGLSPNTLSFNYGLSLNPQENIQMILPCCSIDYSNNGICEDPEKPAGCFWIENMNPNTAPEQIVINKEEEFKTFVRNNTGKYYTIFNEPNDDAAYTAYNNGTYVTDPFQGSATPEQTAKIYYRYRKVFKDPILSPSQQLDPTAKILSPSLAQRALWVPFDYQTYVKAFNTAFNKLVTQKREGMPFAFDYWIIHAYQISPSTKNNATLGLKSSSDVTKAYNATVAAINEARNFYKNIKNLPAWVTEWGYLTQCTHGGSADNYACIDALRNDPEPTGGYVYSYTEKMLNWFESSSSQIDKWFYFFPFYLNYVGSWCPDKFYSPRVTPGADWPCWSGWLYGNTANCYQGVSNLGKLYSDRAKANCATVSPSSTNITSPSPQSNCNCIGADYNGNGVVDINDVNYFNQTCWQRPLGTDSCRDHNNNNSYDVGDAQCISQACFGKTFPTNIPTLILTSTPAPTKTPTPTKYLTPTRTPTPTKTPTPTTNPYRGKIVINAKGSVCNYAYPRMELYMGSRFLKYWNVGANYQDYSYTYSSAITDKIRVKFTNDCYNASKQEDRNLWVDHVIIEGVTYYTKSPGIYCSGGCINSQTQCSSGYFQTDLLGCAGYFEFNNI